MYICMYVTLTMVLFAFTFIALVLGVESIVLCLAMVCAAKVMHENLFMSILKAPMSFFDTTPLGRILNRFSKDTDSIDSTLPMRLQSFLNCIVPSFCVIIIIGYTIPILLLVLIPIMILLVFLQVSIGTF